MERVVQEKKNVIAQADTFTQALKLSQGKKEQTVTKDVSK